MLDIAGGTGDLSLAFSKKVGATGRVVHTDINEAMLRVGRDRLINEYGVSPEEGDEPDADYYSFPLSIYRGGLVSNYSVPGIINYNFTKAKGIAVFNDPTQLFARFRFKATAAGTTDISHIIQYMINIDEQRIYYKDEALAPINPYMVITIEPSQGRFGDADGDYDVTIMGATFMQRVAAGADLAYDAATADVTGDNALSLKDAVIVRKYLAGKAVESNVGSWLFASENIFAL